MDAGPVHLEALAWKMTNDSENDPKNFARNIGIPSTLLNPFGLRH
jgi:hypothetical protein